MVNPKHYIRPQTLEEAVELASKVGAVAVAGGALTLNTLDLPYETVVDLQDLQSFKVIERRAGVLFVGGAVMLQAAVESPEVPGALKQALTRSIPLNVRGGASIGESLLTREPLGEWLAALIVLDARIEHAGYDDKPGQLSLRDQPVDEFVEFVYRHGYRYQGVISGLHIPPLPAHTAVETAFVARTPADKPIVNAAVALTVNERGKIAVATAALGGVSALPILRLPLNPLLGRKLGGGDVSGLAEWIEQHAHPTSDYLGSYEYRVEMAKTLTLRALRGCMAQLTT